MNVSLGVRISDISSRVYVVGETAVDPRACGKMMNIRERW